MFTSFTASQEWNIFASGVVNKELGPMMEADVAHSAIHLFVTFGWNQYSFGKCSSGTDQMIYLFIVDI